MYNHVKNCYKAIIFQDFDNAKQRETFAEFLWEIGEFDNA